MPGKMIEESWVGMDVAETATVHVTTVGLFGQLVPLQEKTMRLAMTRMFGFALLMVVFSLASTERAAAQSCEFDEDCVFAVVGAPEIDSSSIPAALGILSAGVLLLKARRHAK